MEEVKKEATAVTAAEATLQARIEQLSFAYIDFLEEVLKNPQFINTDTLHALNDSIRVIHHLKKMNN